MKRMIWLSLLLTGCGYEARDVEIVGQIKKVAKITPLICPDRMDADISLGVMVNGVGSMSSQDIWVTLPDKFGPRFKELAASGKLVKIVYDRRRFVICEHNEIVQSIEAVK